MSENAKPKRKVSVKYEKGLGYPTKVNHPLFPDKLVREAYQEAHYEYEETAKDIHYKNWWEITRRRPHYCEINQVLRERLGDGREVMYYHIIYRGKDLRKMKKEFDLYIGKVQVPEFDMGAIDIETEEPIATSVSSSSIEYTIDWNDGKSYEKIKNLLAPACQFYAVEAQRPYSIYSKEAFEKMSFDDLITFGRRKRD